jgi:hypothetical protein
LDKALNAVIPKAPEAAQAARRDTLSIAVGELKGRTINIGTPGQFAKAIDYIRKLAGL